MPAREFIDTNVLVYPAIGTTRGNTHGRKRF